MRFSVFRESLAELRAPLLAWTLAMALAAWLVILAHPLFMLLGGDQMLADLRLPGWLAGIVSQSAPQTASLAQRDIWLQQVGMELALPIPLVLLAISKGSWLMAGEEERGSLGLLLAAPLHRGRILLEKFAVLLVLLLLPSLAVWAALSAAKLVGLVSAPAGYLLRSSLGLFLLALGFGGLALAVGSLTGRRKLTCSTMLAFAALALVISWLPGDFPGQPALKLLSPFTYYAKVTLGQLASTNALALLALSAGCLVMAWVIFERRDLPL